MAQVIITSLVVLSETTLGTNNLFTTLGTGLSKE